jgi:hypothetical protein
MARFSETMTVTAISRLAANASWSGFSAGKDSKSAIYNPPPGWVILQTQTEVHSSNNGSRSVSVIGEDLDLVQEELLEQVYKEAIAASGKYKDKSIAGNLKKELEERRNEVRKWKSNKNTVSALVTCAAHGSALDRKRGWEEISVIATLIYIGENSRLPLITEIEQAYKIDVDSMVPRMLMAHGIELSAQQLAIPDPADLDLAERSEINKREEPKPNKPKEA